MRVAENVSFFSPSFVVFSSTISVSVRFIFFLNLQFKNTKKNLQKMFFSTKGGKIEIIVRTSKPVSTREREGPILRMPLFEKTPKANAHQEKRKKEEIKCGGLAQKGELNVVACDLWVGAEQLFCEICRGKPLCGATQTGDFKPMVLCAHVPEENHRYGGKNKPHDA
jgi:hypothetical protein